ncbi:MAG TPA: hypothetical protein VF821_01440 [Lentzea sp.]
MNIDQQLASLLGALDDVLDLERGLADATLPRAHADLVDRLDTALDLEAGLAQVVPPTTGLPPRELDGFIAFAHELSELPAVERLAARAWLPVSLVVEGYVLAKHVPTVRAVADLLHHNENVPDVRRSARMEVRLVVHDLDRAKLRATVIHHVARLLLNSLKDRSTDATGVWIQSVHLHELVARRLATLLTEIDSGAQHIHRGLVDVAFADALLGPLDRLRTALTNVVGADLTSADLSGLPLDGVRWSSGTRWPREWEVWVRDNSVPIAADVFEIRSGKAGSWLPT